MAPLSLTGHGKISSAAEAVAKIADDSTVAVTGSGGGLVEPDALLAAIEKRFLTTGHPRRLTIVHAQGIGDRKARGLNHLAHEGLVKRVVGGHWAWSPRMQELARQEVIEAYALPGGIISTLMREIGAGRPGLFTRVGLSTFVDPRLEGGRMNRKAEEPLVAVEIIGGQEFLHFKPFPVHAAILRGTSADLSGSVSMEEEGANLDGYALALAAHRSRGNVLMQVRRVSENGARPPRDIVIPGPLVDHVVVHQGQRQSYAHDFDPTLVGMGEGTEGAGQAGASGERSIIAWRAALELGTAHVAAFGFGMPDGVAHLLAAQKQTFMATLDHGVYGGQSLSGDLFGFVRGPTAIINSTDQIDFYHGGGIDVAFLGFGEADRFGNVNASKLGGVAVGPGGFIDITHGAAKIVFCGTFDAKGTRIALGEGSMAITAHGAVQKFVADVGQVTFSGKQAAMDGKEVIFVTERAVFRLRNNALVLTEAAAGVDIRRDILERMGFTPNVADTVLAMPLPPTRRDPGPKG